MNVLVSCAIAFLVGGIICLAGQVLIDCTNLTPARILSAFVVAGVLLTAIGIYDPLVRIAGAGATVPLTGFGYALANGVREAIDREGAIGIITGGLTATSSGITAALVLGLLASLIFNSDEK